MCVCVISLWLYFLRDIYIPVLHSNQAISHKALEFVGFGSGLPLISPDLKNEALPGCSDMEGNYLFWLPILMWTQF